MFERDPLRSFQGVTRLFPLPSVVLFPHVLAPLHIFEPRYRAMLADALNSDQLLTTVLLKPGYEEEYEQKPPIYPVGCLGQIIRHDALPDGRSNVVLRGVCRVRIDSEQPEEGAYRMARVTVLEDRYPASGTANAELSELGERVLKSLTELLRIAGRASDVDQILAVRDIPAGKLCDIASHCMGFDAEVKQALLEEPDVMGRVETLFTWMRAVLQSSERRTQEDSVWPGFSPN